SLPLEHHPVLHEAVDRLRHVRQPGSPAHLAVRQDVEADLALPAQRVAYGSILDHSQFVEGCAPLAEAPASFEDFHRTQQASNLLGFVGALHLEAFCDQYDQARSYPSCVDAFRASST